MAIAFRASSSGDLGTPGASTTITLPTGTASTDVVLCVFGSSRVATTSPNAITPGVGWTQVMAAITQNNGTDEVTLDTYWSLGSNTNLSFLNSQTSTLKQGWVAVSFTGVDNTTPIDAVGTANSNTGAASLTANAVTIATANAWEIISVADWLKSGFTVPSFTAATNGNPATNQTAQCYYNTTPKATGSTGTTSISMAAGPTGQIITAQPFALRVSGASPSSGRRRVSSSFM